MVVIGESHLTCRFSATVDVVAGEHAPCGRIDWVSDFFGACCRGGYFKVRTLVQVAYHFFHDEFGHGAAANVAVTDK